MKLKKLIILIISILIPLAGAVGVGFYSYDRYDPEEMTELQSEFKKDLVAKHGADTLGRINLYRQLESYYYEKDPFYLKDVELNGEKLFTIAIYRGFALIKESQESEERYDMKYDLFVYNVNYTALLNEFSKQFTDPSVVHEWDDPYFVVNFYPNEEMVEEDSFYGASLTFKNHTANTSSTINLYDINSTPELNGGNPYYVHKLAIRENDIVGDKDNFQDGKAYITIDAEVSVTESEDGADQTYTKTIESLIEEEITDFKVSASEYSVEEDYEKGWREAGVRDTLNNAGYNGWLFAHYIWWQALIALGIFSLIMVGFYVAFTYEEPVTTKKKRK